MSSESSLSSRAVFSVLSVFTIIRRVVLFKHYVRCRWVQGECRRLGDADAPEVDPVLQRAATALRERPVLFKYCAEEVAQARHNALFQR